MFCTNCGSPNPDQALFCCACGASLCNTSNQGAPAQSAQPENRFEGQPVNRPATETPQESLKQNYCRQDLYSQIPPKKPKNRLPLVIGIPVLAAGAIAGILFATGVLGSGSSKVETKEDAKKETIQAIDDQNTGDISIFPGLLIDQSQQSLPGDSGAAASSEETAQGDAEPTHADAETAQADAEATNADAETAALQESSLRYFDDCGSSARTDPVSSDDFAEVTISEGDFTFMYPKNYFQSGQYDPQTGTISFATADGEYTLKIDFYQFETNDPISVANEQIEYIKSLYYAGNNTPYIHYTEKTDENGIARTIIGGHLADNYSDGMYSMFVCTGKMIYHLTYTYPTTSDEGCGNDATPSGYVIEALYRGWSLAGSDYQIRTYSQYINDEPSTKKPGVQ